MGPVQHLIRLSDQVSKLLMILAALWAMGLAMVIVADIVANNVRGEALPGVREIVISSIVMIVYLQLGYAIRSHSMLRSDTFVLAMPALARKALLGGGYLLGAVFFFMILKGTVAPAVHAWTTSEYWGEGALHMPVWPMRLVVGAGLAIVNYVVAALIDVFGFDERDSG
jgi:TRAP-type C4-dicarboxylate transport system permease small subunit